MSSPNFVLPNGIKLENLLESLRYLSWGAADILMAYGRGEKPPFGFPEHLSVDDKGDGPVSSADLAVNSWLIEGLKANFPGADWIVLSEENVKGQSGDNFSENNNWMWVLDPLDGTKDFLNGTGEYAVHIALLKNLSPKIGVVLIPESEELWFGIIGKGSWCENRLGEKKLANFSHRNELCQMILLASKTHRDKRLSSLIEKLSPGETKGVGSVGCKIATILRGDADFYISLSGKTSPKDWDMAAPEAVLKAAGGKFTQANGQPLVYGKEGFNQSGCLVASHGVRHDFLSNLITQALSMIDS
ncbi:MULTISPECIES: 3'(2'),5'-bisphosphate nucleotidase CysQ family protein [Prochlorococcus]|uniref:3'(2'),5'-bisphosphate nucleotidase CysQ family protein n=1 Tax=Prochlorococcus TaxID=1218 RepID=UPI000533B7FF|nr:MULTISPECIES: 3'(2'),5'-bisphosphate nucleotidase CysQ [Prochlorococcus]KGG12050.1 3'(2'),5'-bisphosphate nucleotidase [Prochlorococcus sp. MIT 0601]